MRIADPDHITNWHRLDSRLTSSGQPSETELKQIRALGVTHVVNLGLHDHEKALADEAATVAALGMDYIHIPVIFDAPTEADYARFAATMAALDGKTVHVHCIANMRVSAFFYRWRQEVQGLSEKEARAAMETIWRPGGVWAGLIGDADGTARGHQVPGRHY